MSGWELFPLVAAYGVLGIVYAVALAAALFVVIQGLDGRW